MTLNNKNMLPDNIFSYKKSIKEKSVRDTLKALYKWLKMLLISP